MREGWDEDDVAETLDLMDAYRYDDFDGVTDDDDEEDNDEDLDEEWWEAAPDPTKFTTWSSFETAGAGMTRTDLHDLWKGAYELDATEKSKFKSGGVAFLDLVDDWVDDFVAGRIKAIAKKKKKYKKKNWKFTAADVKTETDQIQAVEDARRALAVELRAGISHGVDLLVLANVVWNEARGASDAAKMAIAYGYLNITGGAVTTPSTGSLISGFQPLRTRWTDFDSSRTPNTAKLSFLQGFAPSVHAATTRLDDPNPSTNDPTLGADHWVSPATLPLYAALKSTAHRYKRNHSGRTDVGFPDWARDPSDPAVATMQAAGQLRSNYNEFTATGVPASEFLFYTGVK